MSIQSEITRISGNVSDALTAIATKGVTVPSGSNSDDLADLISAIPTGGGGGEDYPTFTVEFDENEDSITSVTCDKTFLECYERITNDPADVVGIYDFLSTSETIRGALTGKYVSYDEIRYIGMESGVPMYEFTYNRNGTLTFSFDASSVTTFTATANGTYTAPWGTVYDTVEISVPPTVPNLQGKTNIAPTTSSQTITADVGFDGLSSVQINAMPSGTAGTPTATKGTVSNHSVTVTPSVINTAGYISGGTKTGTGVSVSASELVSGSETKTANGTYDVTNLASIIVDVSGGGSVKMGVLRPDAELWKSWAYDKLIVTDEGVTLPAYSTNTSTLKNTATLEAVALDRDNYSYFLTTRTLTIPIYSNNTMRSGMELYFANAYGVDISFYKGSEIKALDGTAADVDRYVLHSLSESDIIVYYTTKVVSASLTSGNGAYCTPQVPTGNNATLTVRSPVLRLKGNSTYLSSTAWGYLTDIRYQYVVELWRTPRSASPRGYVISSQLHHVLDCVANNKGDLT